METLDSLTTSQLGTLHFHMSFLLAIETGARSHQGGTISYYSVGIERGEIVARRKGQDLLSLCGIYVHCIGVPLNWKSIEQRRAVDIGSFE